MKKLISILFLITVAVVQMGCYSAYHRYPRSHRQVPAQDAFAMNRHNVVVDESALSCCQYITNTAIGDNALNN